MRGKNGTVRLMLLGKFIKEWSSMVRQLIGVGIMMTKPTTSSIGG
jgi:hypothetical protein